MYYRDTVDGVTTFSEHPYVPYLITKLPNIYLDYVYNDHFIHVLFDAYVDVINYVRDHAESVKNNITISTTDLVNNEALSIIELHNALYDVLKIVQEVDPDWLSTHRTLADKIATLDSLGYYDILDTTDLLGNQGNVVDMRIMKDFSGYLGSYERGKDYVVQNNKLYTFGTLAKPAIYGATRKRVLTKDYAVDRQQLARNWGLFIPQIGGESLSNVEYRSLLQSLVNFEPTVANMRNAVNILSGVNLGGSAVFMDKYSRKNISEEQLVTGNIGQFQFIYKLAPEFAVLMGYGAEIPPEHLDSYYRMQDILNFIRLMKPAHTNFFFATSTSVVDSAICSDNVATISRARNIINETLIPQDSSKQRIGVVITETINQAVTSVFDDDSALYDLSVYDDEPQMFGSISDAVILNVV